MINCFMPEKKKLSHWIHNEMVINATRVHVITSKSIGSSNRN